MLIDIKNLLIEREQVSLMDLSRHFHVSETLMLSLLEQWNKKGRIQRVDTSGMCGSGCGSCDEAEESKIYYRWKPVAEKPIFTSAK
ncbi:MAG: sugar metabolism transcriptional regulator [Kangiella sp.]|nr:MAG: sugar metabolism transcriptional regulator [Kangiella sp.]